MTEAPAQPRFTGFEDLFSRDLLGASDWVLIDQPLIDQKTRSVTKTNRVLTCTYLVAGTGFEPATSGL